MRRVSTSEARRIKELEREVRELKRVNEIVHVAFVIDVRARYIVGWRVGRSMQTDFVLDALEQVLYARQLDKNTLIHHSYRGSQYISIRYTERLAEAGIEPSVGVGGTATTMR